MKKILPIFLFILFAFSINAQLTITEISYNPPESGADSLEYIELYNSTAGDIDLTDYVIRDNNTHVIAGGTVPAMGYAVLAINPGAILSVLGVEAIAIADIALSNGGEGIILEDSNGNVLDEVGYDDNAPWPTEEDGTDGAGATIELCNLNADNNNGANWGVSTNNTGASVGGIDFLGTPAAENSADCEVVPDHIVEVSSNVFTPADITIQVNETVRWMNTGGFHNVNGSQDTYPDNPESFGNGGASGDMWTYDFTFTIPGVYDYQCDPHAGQGMVGTVTVETDIPTYDIGIVNTTDENGEGDSLGVECIIEGITHGANLRGNGLQFALIDESGDAIGLFAGSPLGYTYAEGDLLRVTGTIDQFNGLMQIRADAVEVISSGNDLIGPIDVETLDESTESKLIRLSGLMIVDPADWDGDGGSWNVNFVSAASDTFQLRIDSDTEVADWAEGPVTGLWNITGIGGQFDGDAPFDSGYQMFPRYISDFDMVSSVEDELEANIKVYPNPAANFINIESDIELDQYVLYNQYGQVLSKGVFRASLDVSELPSGNYLIVLSKEDRKRIVQFVK